MLHLITKPNEKNELDPIYHGADVVPEEVKSDAGKFFNWTCDYILQLRFKKNGFVNNPLLAKPDLLELFDSFPLESRIYETYMTTWMNGHFDPALFRKVMEKLATVDNLSNEHMGVISGLMFQISCGPDEYVDLAQEIANEFPMNHIANIVYRAVGVRFYIDKLKALPEDQFMKHLEGWVAHAMNNPGVYEVMFIMTQYPGKMIDNEDGTYTLDQSFWDGILAGYALALGEDAVETLESWLYLLKCSVNDKETPNNVYNEKRVPYGMKFEQLFTKKVTNAEKFVPNIS